MCKNHKGSFVFKTILVITFIVLGNTKVDGIPYRPYHETKSRYVLHKQGVKISWYGGRFHGRKTASGERFNKHLITAASRDLPLGSFVLVENISNKKTLLVKINDRGPFIRSRVLDLSERAAILLGFKSKGVAKVNIWKIA